MELSDQLIKIARTINARFSLHGKPLTLNEVLSPNALLPAIARRADQLCSLCLGYGLGITLEEEEGTVMGVRVVFDDITPNSLRLLCILDVLSELMLNGGGRDLVALDQLLYD